MQALSIIDATLGHEFDQIATKWDKSWPFYFRDPFSYILLKPDLVKSQICCPIWCEFDLNLAQIYHPCFDYKVYWSEDKKR